MNKEYTKFIDKVIVIKTQKSVVFLGETGSIHKLFYGDYPNDLISGEVGEIYYTWHETGGSEKYFRLEIQPKNISELYDLFDKYIENVKKNSFKEIKCRYL